MGVLGRDRVITQKQIRGFMAQSFMVLRRKLVFSYFTETRDSYSYRDFYGMIGTPPQMGTDEVLDMTDAPPSGDFYEWSQNWTNKLYKMKFWLGRSLLDFDQTGQVWTLLHQAAARLANFPDKLFFTRLKDAAANTTGTPLDYTNNYFYSNRAIGNSVVNNVVLGGLSVGGWNASNRDAMAQLILNDFTKAKSRMLAFKDDRGEPFHYSNLDEGKIVILCSPALVDVMRYAFEAAEISGTSNVMKGQVQTVITSNYLPGDPSTDATALDWHMAYVGERNKPWVYSRFRRRRDSEMQDPIKMDTLQKVEGFENATLEDLRELTSVGIETNLGRQGTNAEVDTMLHERYLVQARARMEIFPGEPRNMILVDNSL